MIFPEITTINLPTLVRSIIILQEISTPDLQIFQVAEVLIQAQAEALVQVQVQAEVLEDNLKII